MRRRDFIAGLGAAASPLAAQAQQPAVPVIGLLGFGSRDVPAIAEFIEGIRRGLAEMGFVEGRNLNIDYRAAEYRLEGLQELAADLVRRNVAAIIVTTTPAALAARDATKSIPIVFTVGSDPVEIGLVASLSRPDGNLTGIYNFNKEVAAKRLELLREIVPVAITIAYLVNPANSAYADTEMTEMRGAASILGVKLLTLNVTASSEFESAFEALAREGAGGLVVGGDLLFYLFDERIIALAARYKVPAVYVDRREVVKGGLASYGSDPREASRVIGGYVGRLLKGEKPADLPVQQVTKAQLAINTKTAKALGLTFPLTLLGRADEVIE